MSNFTYLAWGVGLGKTREALERATNAGVNKIIVFAPSVLRKMRHWENEALKWGYDTPMEVYTYHRLQQYGKSDMDHKLDNQGEGVAIIIDEAHKIKNSQSLQGLGAFKLIRDNPKAQVYLLSGTPAPNGYQDFCNYAKMTNFVKHKTDFFDRYVIMTNFRGFPEVKGYHNTKELDDWWHSIADTKPPTIFTKEHDIWVNFPSVSNELYAKRTRVGILNGNRYLLENASQLTHFCRQAACGTKTRRDWLENFFEGTDENIVVFVSYKLAMDDILKIAKKVGKKVYQVDGSVKNLPDDETAKSLKNSVTAVNYQSGGVGLNLQYANHAIFYTPTYSYSDYEQARGRISRRGQTKPCNFYHLQADKSIERDIYQCLNDKKDFSAKLWSSQYKTDGEEDSDIILI